jgi:hypothetical protein
MLLSRRLLPVPGLKPGTAATYSILSASNGSTPAALRAG